MRAPKSLFNPHDVQPGTTLTVVQKYLLRVVFGWAGKTVLHRGNIVEVIDTRSALRRVVPLVESNLSESNVEPFWIPANQCARKRFNTERRDKSRRHSTIGIVWGDQKPPHYRRQTLRSTFPNMPYLYYLVTELGYPLDAAQAAFARPKIQPLPDKRTTSVRSVSHGENLYVPEAVPRRTLTGGGFTEKQVREGLSKMRANGRVGQALFEIVYRRRSTKQVAQEFDLTPEKLYVYASRLRGHIRRQKAAAPVPLLSSPIPVPDLRRGESLMFYLQ